MKTKIRLLFVAITVIVTLASTASSQSKEDAAILQCRETVWRAWFANDSKTLAELVPPEAISISPSEDEWQTQADILRGADEFQAQGGKLIRLEFPRTKIQRYGDVAFVYSQFLLETETSGKRSLATGRATEIFVLRNGHWINPGWHTDSHK
jgi:ketosteroid isomerase-like protein